ncbi:MAG: hypothetical protein AAGA71_05765 [Pseudomonadota bacterium]
MSAAKDFAKETGALCVGATAFALGDPSGGTLLAMPLTALAALGLTLQSGCAEKASEKAQRQILKALAANPEFADAEIERARIILKDAPAVASLDPKALAKTVHGQDLEKALSEMIIGTLGIGADDGNVRDIVLTALVAGIAVCKADQDFRDALTLELVIESARKQAYEIALAEDMNQTVKRVLEHVETSSLEDLRICADFFEDSPDGGASKFDLMAFLKSKAEDIKRLVAEREALPSTLPRLENVRAAVTAAIENFNLDEAEALLDGARDVHKTEMLRPALEANAALDEQKAEILLLRGRVNEAYRILSATADSFAGFDALEPARRRILTYWPTLRNHGLRYGGDGLPRSRELLEPILTSELKGQDSRLWAAGQNALAVSLQEQGTRTAGEVGASLLSQAVDAYRAALRVYTEDAQPVDWAMTQNNLGNALRNQGIRTAGEDGAALLAQAIDAYRAALRVRTENAHPVDWAMTQNNLGNALRNQGTRTAGEDGAALLAQAVDAYRAALRVYTEDAHPVDWATTQNNLGTALDDQGTRTAGEDGAALLAQAVDAYRAALRVRTEVAQPVQWAMTQNNLGNALRDQSTGTGRRRRRTLGPVRRRLSCRAACSH